MANRSKLCGAMVLALGAALALGTAGTASASAETATTGEGALAAVRASLPSECTWGQIPTDSFLFSNPQVGLFLDGADAFHRKDYRHALYMFKVAASYASAQAEYDLGLMYFRGIGIPEDRPLGAAWMILAAQAAPQTELYATARDLLVSALDSAQFEETQRLWRGLNVEYGYDSGHAKELTAFGNAKMFDVVGSHVGHTIGPVSLGGLAPPWNSFFFSPGSGTNISVGYLDYAQWSTGRTPYAPGDLTCPMGTVRVGPLRTVPAAKS